MAVNLQHSIFRNCFQSCIFSLLDYFPSKMDMPTSSNEQSLAQLPITIESIQSHLQTHSSKEYPHRHHPAEHSLLNDAFYRLEAARDRALIHIEQLRTRQQQQDPDRSDLVDVCPTHPPKSPNCQKVDYGKLIKFKDRN